jgi:two-component system, OmpR family, response regulator
VVRAKHPAGRRIPIHLEHRQSIARRRLIRHPFFEEDIQLSDLIRILVIDDDPSVLKAITEYLGANEIEVAALPSGQGIAALMASEIIDLVILDLRLPGDDGIKIARSLREQSGIPIIMLSGRDEEADRVMSLELGADDYLTKPFSPRELLARIRALLRRSRSHRTVAEEMQKLRAYRFAGWELNVRVRRLTSPNGGAVSLTNHQFNLLTAFLAAPQRVLSRDALLSLSRLHNDEVYDRSVDVQVARLRKKMQHDNQPQLIRTERGAGYVFTAGVQAVR